LLQFPAAARHLGQLIAGSDVRYDMAGSGQAARQGGGLHALVARLAPDLRLATADGQTRVAELMRPARPVLLDFTDDGRIGSAAADWAGPVTLLTVKTADRDGSGRRTADPPGRVHGVGERAPALRAWRGQPASA
jgi:hypothetical protein